jgi:hypothetical protein
MKALRITSLRPAGPVSRPGCMCGRDEARTTTSSRPGGAKRAGPEQRKSSWLVRLVTQGAVGALAVSQLAGCATNRLEDWHNEAIARTERFYPTGPAREAGNQLYLQGVTKRIKGYCDPYFDPAPVLEQHSSYLAIDATNHRLGRSQWIDPGSLPDEVLAGTEVPKRVCGRELFRPEEFSPGLHAIYSEYHYSSGDVVHHIVFQSPEEAAENKWRNHYCNVPRSERRLPSERPLADWVLYPVAFTVALGFDVVTSPFQLIGLMVAFSHFSI